MNDFEKRLHGIELRRLPAEWREEILSACDRPSPERQAERPWREWLWPSPWAWGALAAVWLVVLRPGLSSNYSTGVQTAGERRPSAPPYLLLPRRELEALLAADNR